MKKHFYISTKVGRRDDASRLAGILRQYGWKASFDWTLVPDDAAPATIAESEICGIREAECVIVLLPGGFGTHVEIGAALALGKRIILHSPDHETLQTPYPCVFHYHPLVTLIIEKQLPVHEVLRLLEC